MGRIIDLDPISYSNSQQPHIDDADGSLADITTKFNTLLDYLVIYGVLAGAETVNRRRASSGFFLFLIPPIPDNDIDNADDRYHNAGFYRSFT